MILTKKDIKEITKRIKFALEYAVEQNIEITDGINIIIEKDKDNEWLFTYQDFEKGEE